MLEDEGKPYCKSLGCSSAGKIQDQTSAYGPNESKVEVFLIDQDVSKIGHLQDSIFAVSPDGCQVVVMCSKNYI